VSGFRLFKSLFHSIHQRSPLNGEYKQEAGPRLARQGMRDISVPVVCFHEWDGNSRNLNLADVACGLSNANVTVRSEIRKRRSVQF
jgi:hypothetical protein